MTAAKRSDILIVQFTEAGDQRLYYERRPGQFNTVPGIEKVRIVTKDSLFKNHASMSLEQPNQVGRYYRDLTPLIGKEIFSPSHEVHSDYTAAFTAYRLEFMFRNRRIDPAWKPFRFQLVMATKLYLEGSRDLDPRRKRSQAYCNAIDAVMSEPDEAQTIFGIGGAAIEKAIVELKDQGGARDRRTAKIKDMRDALRQVFAR